MSTKKEGNQRGIRIQEAAMCSMLEVQVRKVTPGVHQERIQGVEVQVGMHLSV